VMEMPIIITAMIARMAATRRPVVELPTTMSSNAAIGATPMPPQKRYVSSRPRSSWLSGEDMALEVTEDAPGMKSVGGNLCRPAIGYAKTPGERHARHVRH